MRYQTKMAVWMLSLVCLILSIAVVALADPSVTEQAESPASSESSDIAQAAPAATQVSQKPDTPPVKSGDKDSQAAETRSEAQPSAKASTPVQAALAPKPAPAPKTKPFPDARTAASTSVDVLRKEHPGFIERVLNSTRSLMNRAVSWLGTRYVWGGISRRGVDCSGLTRLLLQSEGINVPRTARQQFQHGRPVAKSALLPGDLVFFNTRGPLTHVGMYIGNQKFIHAASRRRGVTIDSINTPYYRNRYAGARRYKDFSS